MEVKKYRKLPEEAKQIRTKVFMEEQGFEREFDEIDECSVHFVVFEEGCPAATCRMYYSQKMGSYVIGRLAVLKEFRGQGYGAQLLRSCEEAVRDLQADQIGLFAQKRAVVFYEKSGYTATDLVTVDEGCVHVWMRKALI